MLSMSRFQTIHKSMTNIAQKVYAAVPASEAWGMSVIFSEMQRMGYPTRDIRVMQGCLNNLKEAGLVSEPERGRFIRTPVKAEKAQPTLQPETQEILSMPPAKLPSPLPEKSLALVPAPEPTRSPMSILSALALRCRSLADEVETVALEIDEMFAAQNDNVEKLAQLQKILKSLG